LTSMANTTSVRSKGSRYVPLRTTTSPTLKLAAEEVFMLAATCAFVVLNLHGQSNSYIFNMVELIPGLALTFKCCVQNNDRSLLAMVIIAAHWGFCLLALMNESFLNIDENYMTLRLLLLGALGVKAYENVQLIDNVQEENPNSGPSKSTFETKRARSVSENSEAVRCSEPPSKKDTVGSTNNVSAPQSAANNPVQEPTAQNRPSTPPASSSPRHHPIDPRLQEILQKIRTELDAALRVTASAAGTRGPARSRNNQQIPPETTQPLSLFSRLNTLRDHIRNKWFSQGTQVPSYHSRNNSLRDQLGTSAAPTTAHRTSARGQHGTEANIGSEQAECEAEHPSTVCTSDYQTATCAMKLPAQQRIIDKSKVTVHYGDLITNPMNTVRFSAKENFKRIVVTNLATETIMWSLKADLKGSFDASPAYGLLRSGEKQVIILCLAPRKVLKNSMKTGKIGIDYAFVEPFTRKFDRNVYKSLEKRRHLLQAVID
ncbi:hypothetical protein V3C99_016967, partial [Haemonchus contortus]